MGKWINADMTTPDNMREVLVSDGDGSFAVAWYHKADKGWKPAVDMIEAYNYDGYATVSISQPVKCWMEIPTKVTE